MKTVNTINSMFQSTPAKDDKYPGISRVAQSQLGSNQLLPIPGDALPMPEHENRIQIPCPLSILKYN